MRPKFDSSEKLNESVHQVVKHMLSQTPNQGHSLILDVDSFIDSVCTVAPELWEHVQILTRSINERRGRRAAISTTSYSSHLKRLRRAYLLSVLLFVTNNECSFPFHTLLADAIETSGGSTELITILNRVGAVASVDTLKRVILAVSQERKKQGIRSLLVQGSFTVASVDNIDFLQSHAAVYSGSQHRSWHATSIQLVQPQPNKAVAQSQSLQAAIQPQLDQAVNQAVQLQPHPTGSRPRRLFDIINQKTSTVIEVSQAHSIANDPVSKLHTLLSRKRPERSSPLLHRVALDHHITKNIEVAHLLRAVS